MTAKRLRGVKPTSSGSSCTFLFAVAVSAEIRHLRVVVAAGDSGSFSAAALRLNMEVSAVSRAVRDVEQEIGVSIFDRLPRGVRLTEAGRSYVASAREILERYERAGLDARRAGMGESLNLSVGFPWSVASKPFVELLRTFGSQFTTVRVEVVEGSNDQIVDWLRADRLDVAVAATDPPPQPRLKELGALATMPLWLEPLAAAIPANVEITTVTWENLADARLLCRTLHDWPRFVQYVERLGGPRLSFEPHAVSQEGLLGLVAAGLG